MGQEQSTSTSLSLWPRLPIADIINLNFPVLFAFSLIQKVKFSTQLLFITKSRTVLERMKWSCSPISRKCKRLFWLSIPRAQFLNIPSFKNHKIGNLPSSFLGSPFLCKFFLHSSLGKPTLFLLRFLKSWSKMSPTGNMRFISLLLVDTFRILLQEVYFPFLI